MDVFSQLFISALQQGDMECIKTIPKADLHNHFVLGGSRMYIHEKTGFHILPCSMPLKTMDEMHTWSAQNLNRFNTTEGRMLLIEAAFVQAKADGVSVLELGEDVWALGEYFDSDIDKLLHAFIDTKDKIAPHIQLRLQIGLSRHCGIDYLLRCLEPFWGRNEFYSIDLYGDELCQPIENFIPIYKKAKDNGLVLKAHIGEWGTAQDVKKAVELLQLDEVQHGIAAAESQNVMEFLRQRNIRLNITPSSNVMLGRVSAMQEHPIAKLHRAGIDVTINSDDILIFDSHVSKEYLRLFKCNVLSASELDAIRRNGLANRSANAEC